VEGFHGGSGQPDVQPLVKELIGDAVVMFFNLDMVVEAYPGFEPFGIFIRPGR